METKTCPEGCVLCAFERMDDDAWDAVAPVEDFARQEALVEAF